MKQTAAVLADAKSEGAQLVVSACNLSHMLLDVYQGKAGKTTGQATKVPTIHLTELSWHLHLDTISIDWHSFEHAYWSSVTNCHSHAIFAQYLVQD